MKYAERESFLKNFFVFFVSLAILCGLLAYFEYLKRESEMRAELFGQMKLCSFDLKCTQFEFDFVPLQASKQYQLIMTEQEYYALFPISKNTKYALKLSLSQAKFEILLHEVKITILEYYLFALIVIAILSGLFSMYALYPLKRALHLTEEFSRDILHDLNTPMSILRLNVDRLHFTPEDELKIKRIKQSIETVVSLGNNLRNYLDEHERQIETFVVGDIINDRVSMLQKLYPDINFITKLSKLKINTNRDAFVRVVDNILNNAAKYNTAFGNVIVEVNLQNATVSIEDNGDGIVYPEKIFDRFYKEHERGLGIGLHIVKKLCDEMKIPITVDSQIGKGSLFVLHLKKQAI